jgi:replicative DNA helicase Mcm
LLVGDPSVGKSQLLKSISTLAPLGYYSLGKGTSTAGLTAAVLKDDKGEYLIFAGVMVLTDKGVACIDEIDKMNPEDRVAMHEAMEQQTVTINKANIHATLMARTTVVSAANPILGRYDPNKNIADNIKNLPATLLSRFDLIFIIVDTAEKERDELLVSHILEESESRQRIDRNLIKNYIIVAKSYSPVMTIEAKKVIKKFYLESRERQSASDPIPITARQLESLVRMAEAHAKLSFKDKVEIEDAEAAIRLLSLSLRQTCKFQTSGADIDNTEAPKNYQAKETVIMDIIETAGTISEDDFREHCLKKGIMVEDADKIAMHLSNRGRINKTFYPSGWSSLHQP